MVSARSSAIVDVDRRRDRLRRARGSSAFTPLDDVEDVRARLAADDHQDRALAVDPAGDAVVLDVVEDASRRRRGATARAVRGTRRSTLAPGRRRRAAGRWRRSRSATSAPLDAALRLVRRSTRAERARARPPAPRPMPASAAGSTCTRTAGCWPPPTNDLPDARRPAQIFCASTRVRRRRTPARSGSVFDVQRRGSGSASRPG